jgi:glutamate-1-semialdehyde 2,1-aminomutase
LGSHVWDVDGNEFIEYGMGLRSVTLGHAFPPVVQAAYEQMLLGTNFTQPAPIEVRCAEELLGVVSGADMVKFTKDGSTATTAAVKLARAYTGRDMVALCGDHPFFSYDDWFIGTTPMDAGIPRAIKDLSCTFRYNDAASLATLFQEHAGRIACVILEASRGDDTGKPFLQEAAQLCRQHGAVLIFDEMITGFRWHLGGAQAYYGVTPDLSTFGKAMANGFALSALVGKREIMDLGGLGHSKERVFLLSTTHGAETHALAAAVKTMEIYRVESVVEYLHDQGEKLAGKVTKAIDESGLADYVQVVGRPCNLAFVTRDLAKQASQAFRTLFLQETIKRGVLMPSLVVSFSHSDADVEHTAQSVFEALRVYRKALEDGVERYLVGPPSNIVFRKFN